MRWAIALFAAALVAFGAWAIVEGNRWTKRCHDAGGTVENRFEGFMTIYVGNPPVPQLQPQYSDHCWIDGREVSV